METQEIYAQLHCRTLDQKMERIEKKAPVIFKRFLQEFARNVSLRDKEIFSKNEWGMTEYERTLVYNDHSYRTLIDIELCEIGEGKVVAAYVAHESYKIYQKDYPVPDEYRNIRSDRKIEYQLLCMAQKNATAEISRTETSLNDSLRRFGQRLELRPEEEKVVVTLNDLYDGSISKRCIVNIDGGTVQESELKKLLFLIVEDQTLPLEVLTDAVRRMAPKYCDTVCYDVIRDEIGLRSIHWPHRPYDAVLLDHRLPIEFDRNVEENCFENYSRGLQNIGYTFISRIKRDSPKTVIVGTSSFSNWDEALQSFYQLHRTGRFDLMDVEKIVKEAKQPDYVLRKTWKEAGNDLDRILEEVIRKDKDRSPKKDNEEAESRNCPPLVLVKTELPDFLVDSTEDS